MRLLILGAGSMASSHAKFFKAIPGVTLAGAVDVVPASLAAFSDKHGIANRFASLAEAIAWNEFDAAANVTPDSVHYQSTLDLIAAGKHVFCEKPLATGHAKALEMTEAAEKAGLVAMVNLTYRNVAPLQAARKLVLSGAVGAVRHVEASYLQSWLVSKAWGDWRTDPRWLWRLSKKHGSNGTLGDIGVHILDFAAFGAAQDVAKVYCRLQTFPKAPGDRIGDYDLDANDSFAMTVEFGNGALGVIHATRFAPGHLNELRLRVYGAKGGLEVVHNPEGSLLRTCLGADVETATWSDVAVEPVPTNYESFAAAVAAGVTREPSFRHAAELQKVLDLGVETEMGRGERAV